MHQRVALPEPFDVVSDVVDDLIATEYRLPFGPGILPGERVRGRVASALVDAGRLASVLFMA